MTWRQPDCDSIPSGGAGYTVAALAWSRPPTSACAGVHTTAAVGSLGALDDPVAVRNQDTQASDLSGGRWPPLKPQRTVLHLGYLVHATHQPLKRWRLRNPRPHCAHLTTSRADSYPA